MSGNKELRSVKRCPNPNGRPVGSVNKRSKEARAIFDEEGFDPIRNAIKKLKEVEDPELYISSCIKLAKYCYSELKSVDHTINPSVIDTEELKAEAARMLEALKGQE